MKERKNKTTRRHTLTQRSQAPATRDRPPTTTTSTPSKPTPTTDTGTNRKHTYTNDKRETDRQTVCCCMLSFATTCYVRFLNVTDKIIWLYFARAFDSPSSTHLLHCSCDERRFVGMMLKKTVNHIILLPRLSLTQKELLLYLLLLFISELHPTKNCCCCCFCKRNFSCPNSARSTICVRICGTKMAISSTSSIMPATSFTPSRNSCLLPLTRVLGRADHRAVDRQQREI